MENSTLIYQDEILSKIPFEEIDKHPNILIAARIWDDDRYNAAVSCYTFMRHLDDLIDDRKATGKIFNCMERKQFTTYIQEWLSCLKQPKMNHELFADISKTVDIFKIPLNVFQQFTKSMLYDINHNGFKTYKDFLTYAEGASVAPAAIFVHLCGIHKIDNIYQAPTFDIMEVARPCAIFSYLVHIIRDFQKDQREHLNYFANDVLKENELTVNDLSLISKGDYIPENFRNVIRFYMTEARKYQLQTQQMIEKLRPLVDHQYLISLELIFELYLLVLDKIDCENGRFTSEELNPTPRELKQRVFNFLSHQNAFV